MSHPRQLELDALGQPGDISADGVAAAPGVDALQETLPQEAPNPLTPNPGLVCRRGRPRLPEQLRSRGARLRARRQELGIAITALAARLGVEPRVVDRWERAFDPKACAAHLDALATLLQVTRQWLASDEPARVEPPPFPAARFDLAKRQALAQRASARRRTVAVRRAELAERLGQPAHRISLWERTLPARLSDTLIRAWEETLQVPAGWLLNLAADTPEPNPRRVQPACGATTVTDEIRAVAESLVRARPSGNHAAGDLSELEQRNARLFVQRYGVAGPRAATLEATGEAFGLTRERARQITDKLLERAWLLQADTPRLDELRQALAPRLPARVDALDEALRPLLGGALSIEDAQRFSTEVLGKPLCSIERELPWGARLAAPVAYAPAGALDAVLGRAVLDTAFATIRSAGAASVEFVAGAASRALNTGVRAADVERICALLPEFEWISQADGWFWFGPERPGDNRLLTGCEKVLALARERIDVEDLHQAVARSRRSFYDNDSRPFMLDPPMRITSAVLRRVPWAVCVQSDDFRHAAGVQAVEPPSPLLEQLLSDSELAVVEIMARAGGAAARHSLNRKLTDSGRLKAVTLAVTLQSSPIVRQLGTGLFALRGWPLTPEAFGQAHGSVGGGAASWRALRGEGEVATTAGVVLSAYRVANGVLDVSGRLRLAVPADGYWAEADEGFACTATLVHDSNGRSRVTGLMGPLRRAGLVQAGDRLVLDFDVPGRRVQVRIERNVGSGGESPGEAAS